MLSNLNKHDFLVKITWQFLLLPWILFQSHRWLTSIEMQICICVCIFLHIHILLYFQTVLEQICINKWQIEGSCIDIPLQNFTLCALIKKNKKQKTDKIGCCFLIASQILIQTDQFQKYLSWKLKMSNQGAEHKGWKLRPLNRNCDLNF